MKNSDERLEGGCGEAIEEVLEVLRLRITNNRF